MNLETTPSIITCVEESYRQATVSNDPKVKNWHVSQINEKIAYANLLKAAIYSGRKTLHIGFEYGKPLWSTELETACYNNGTSFGIYQAVQKALGEVDELQDNPEKIVYWLNNDAATLMRLVVSRPISFMRY